MNKLKNAAKRTGIVLLSPLGALTTLLLSPVALVLLLLIGGAVWYVNNNPVVLLIGDDVWYVNRGGVWYMNKPTTTAEPEVQQIVEPEGNVKAQKTK
jgi:hypothetical protein